MRKYNVQLLSDKGIPVFEEVIEAETTHLAKALLYKHIKWPSGSKKPPLSLFLPYIQAHVEERKYTVPCQY